MRGAAPGTVANASGTYRSATVTWLLPVPRMAAACCQVWAISSRSVGTRNSRTSGRPLTSLGPSSSTTRAIRAHQRESSQPVTTGQEPLRR